MIWVVSWKRAVVDSDSAGSCSPIGFQARRVSEEAQQAEALRARLWQADSGGLKGNVRSAKGDNTCQAGTCEGRSNWASTRVASEDTGRGTSAGRARK